MCLWTKSKNTTQQQNKNLNLKLLQELAIEPGASCTQSGCVTTAPPSQLKVSIVNKLHMYLTVSTQWVET